MITPLVSITDIKPSMMAIAFAKLIIRRVGRFMLGYDLNGLPPDRADCKALHFDIPYT